MYCVLCNTILVLCNTSLEVVFGVSVCVLLCSRLQQEYQTLYHHSFRVADYVSSGDGSKMRTLMEACTGIGVSSQQGCMCRSVRENIHNDLVLFLFS